MDALTVTQVEALDDAESVLRCIDSPMEERVEVAQRLCVAFGRPFALYTDDEEEGEDLGGVFAEPEFTP